MIGQPLRDEQIERTLERHHVAEGTELMGIEYDWEHGFITITVKEPAEPNLTQDHRGHVRRLLVPEDVREMPAPEPDRRRRG